MRGRGTPITRRIHQTAARSHGVLSGEQLLGLELSRDQILHLVDAGHLHRLHRDVFSIVPPALLSQEGVWLAGVHAGGPGAVLSHGPAGQLLGFLNRRERFALHISVPGRLQRRAPGIVTHRPRRLDPRDITKRAGIPVTTATRTVWDLATIFSPKRTREAFHKAEKFHLLDRVRLAELLAMSPNRKGAGTIRELLGGDRLPLDRTRTWLEDLLVLMCDEHSLPQPLVNVPLLGYEADFLWPDARYVVEADGGDHLNREQRNKDNEKDATFQRADYMVRRYSCTAMGREAEVVTEVRGDLAARLP